MTEEILNTLIDIKESARTLALIPARQRSDALRYMARQLLLHRKEILRANETDRQQAIADKLSPSRINILTISEKNIQSMADFFLQVAEYEDPVGKLLEEHVRENLRREKRLQPLGVVAMVYEARPSVITDCAALCMRSGNALLLRGSSRCHRTDETIVSCLKDALKLADIAPETITLISGDHELTYELAKQDRYIDLMILRGGYSCLEDIKRQATVPVIGAGPGNCHIYIDESAKPEMALAIVHNSKVPRPLACNAAETILINRDWAADHLLSLADMLTENGILLRGCPEVCSMFPGAEPAGETDWAQDYFARTVAVKLVADVLEAVWHINRYRTPHTECIITEDESNARYFQSFVEANVVCWNASTRLTDGMEFGMGGEMGISTQKYPVGGPIGISHLMQEKYYLIGNGALRQ